MPGYLLMIPHHQGLMIRAMMPLLLFQLQDVSSFRKQRIEEVEQSWSLQQQKNSQIIYNFLQFHEINLYLLYIS